jgi:thiol:disulfide interchange protein
MGSAPSHIQIGRWTARAAIVGAALLALIAWAGFEVHDEAVLRPAPRAVRLAVVSSDQGIAAVEYVEGYEAGLRRAAADDRPLLVIFRAGWCRWCAELAQGPLADRRLVELSRHFVCVVVDADRHAADCKRCGIKEFPTVLLASSDGEERRRWTGCPTVDELVTAMSGGLTTARMAAADAAGADATR